MKVCVYVTAEVALYPFLPRPKIVPCLDSPKASGPHSPGRPDGYINPDGAQWTISLVHKHTGGGGKKITHRLANVHRGRLWLGSETGRWVGGTGVFNPESLRAA